MSILSPVHPRKLTTILSNLLPGHFAKSHSYLQHGNKVASTLRKLKTEISFWKRIKCFPSTLRWRNLKTQQFIPVVSDWRLRKTQTVKYHDHRNVSAFEKLRFQMFSVHTKMQSRCFKIPPVVVPESSVDGGPGGVLPNMGYIGMCGPKG